MTTEVSQAVTLSPEDWDRIKSCIVYTEQNWTISTEESAPYWALIDRIDSQLSEQR